MYKLSEGEDKNLGVGQKIDSEQCSEAIARTCSIKKDVLKNFAKFTGTHQCSCRLQS